MLPGKMHADETVIEIPLVRRLLRSQFPRWAGLPIEPVLSAGTVNAIYRLGRDMAVRLPRRTVTPAKVDKEHRWLPKFAPFLPLEIPVPLARGFPAEGYPWPWSVYRWLEGETADTSRIADPLQAATRLGQFVAALHRIDPSGGPLSGAPNSTRGEPLARRDEETRAAIAELTDTYDPAELIGAWEAAISAPAWDEPPVWVHGDLHATNLLARHGQLSAVIDFGSMAVGDPASDVMVAWTYLSARTREAFRAALPVDDATWTRGRGWALSFGLVALPYYQRRNPVLAGIARHSIDEALADHR